jgi:gamma-glutamyltranspeptidase / glutathione hydrolase
MSAFRIITGVVLLSGFSSFPTVSSQEQEPAQPSNRTMRPVLRGREHAVSSMKAEATAAAVRILEAGGNAFDAAVAGQAVLSLVDPDSNGIGSDAVILLYDAKKKQVLSINAEGTAPKLATIEWYQKNNDGKLPQSDGLLAASLPGVVDAWYLLLDRWGTMTFEQVLQPAIEVAERGFPVSESLARGIASSRKLKKYPTSVKVYLADGRPPAPGEIFKNLDAAATLKKLVEAERRQAAKGRHAALEAARDRFYKGDIAQAMGKFFAENGGLYRYEDFAAYSAKVDPPVSIDYRGYRIYKNPSASQGPAELFALNMLESFDLKAMGHNSAEYIHTNAEAVKLAMADREKYLGDMDFIRIPYDGLLSKDYARERRSLIDPKQASHELRPGNPEKYQKTTDSGSPEGLRNAGHAGADRPIRVTLDGEADHAGDTSYLAVVDRDRNMVSFEPSLHSGFGTGVVVGDLGFIFNCRGDYYSLVKGEANALEPGKRPRSTLQSTLVMKDDRPFMVVGSPGGDDQIMRTLQTLVNVVDFGMNVQQAIEAPRWSTRSFPASPFPHTMYPGDLSVEPTVSEEVRKALEAKGHKLRVARAWSLGANGAIVVDHVNGVLAAGVDPRTEGYAWAK